MSCTKLLAIQTPPDDNPAAYFKSTDGHTSQWAFNLRRANLHLLPIIVAHSGIVLVDSTRRGKRHPDALSRTVPIWCAVINQALGFNNEHSCLFTPPDAVSPSEHAQMEEKIAGWVDELKASYEPWRCVGLLLILHVYVGFCIHLATPCQAATTILDQP